MVFIYAKDLLKLLFPGIGVNGARLELVFEFLGAEDTKGFDEGLLGTIRDRRVLLLDFLGVENLLDTVLSDLESCLVGLHVRVGAAKLHIVENAPIQIFDSSQNQVVVEAEHVEGQEVRGLFGIASNTEHATDLEDKHGSVECQIVKLLSDVLRLSVEVTGGLLDAFQDVEANFNGVFAGQLLVVLSVRLEVGLSTGKGLLDSVLQLSDGAELMLVPKIIGVVWISLHFTAIQIYL